MRNWVCRKGRAGCHPQSSGTGYCIAEEVAEGEEIDDE